LVFEEFVVFITGKKIDGSSYLSSLVTKEGGVTRTKHL
jgi:hypothetical protein